jgi:tetratricopeptide (TPR) repeat protein
VTATPDPAGLHEQAESALAEGDAPAAASALQAILRHDPDDVDALVALGHLDHRAGREQDAVGRLERAAQLRPEDPAVVRNLLDLHRLAGHRRDAAAWAERLVALRPTDPLALLDLAELHLALGEHAAARATFARLRDASAGAGRGIVAVHGMVEAEVLAGHLRAALDLAVDATGLDRTPLTTDLLAFLVAAVFGAGAGGGGGEGGAGDEAARPAPSAAAVHEALAAERRAHRARLEAAVLDEGPHEGLDG